VSTIRALVCAAALLLSAPAWAGEIYLHAAGALTKGSGGCTRVQNDGTAGPIVSMQCSQTGTQELFWWVPIPSDFGSTITPTITYHTGSVSAGNLCFRIRLTAFATDGSAANMLTAAAATNTVTITDANLTAVVNSPNQGAGTSLTPQQRTSAGLTSCAVQSCQNLYGLVQVERMNDGSCSSNLATNAQVDMLRLAY